MSSALSNASIALMKREKVSLVAATGLIFEQLKKTSQDITLEKSLISYKGGTWGAESVEGIGFPVLRSSNMRGKRVDVTEAAWCNVPEEQAESFALESGDILVTKSSGSIDLVGKAALFNDPNDGNTYLFSNFTMRLKPDRKKVIPEYLAWFLRSPQAFSWRFDKQQTTVGLRNLQTKEYLSQEIPIPDLDVQQQIVDYLHALENDNQDSNHLKLPTTLTEQRRIVAQIESLATRVNEAQRLREEASEEANSLERSIIDKVYKSCLEQYGTIELANVCDSITDGDHITPKFEEKGVKFIFVGNVSSGFLHFRNCKYVLPEYFAKVRPQRKAQLGDILYSAVGATLGVTAIVDQQEDFCFQRHIAIIKPNREKLDSRFLWYVLRSATIFDFAWANTTGSAQPTVPLNAIRKFPVVIPPLDTQWRIVAYLDGLQAKVNALRELQSVSGDELSALMPSILDKAFRGDL